MDFENADEKDDGELVLKMQMGKENEVWFFFFGRKQKKKYDAAWRR